MDFAEYEKKSNQLKSDNSHDEMQIDICKVIQSKNLKINQSEKLECAKATLLDIALLVFALY